MRFENRVCYVFFFYYFVANISQVKDFFTFYESSSECCSMYRCIISVYVHLFSFVHSFIQCKNYA
jgi:hypothetical protein